MSTAANNSHMNSSAGPRKGSVDYCSKFFLRSVLYVFNFVFWCSGGVFLGVGLYILLNNHNFISLLGSTMFPLTTYLLLAIGGLVILIGCLGCIGACQENKCCLFTYSLFLLLIFLLEAVTGVLAYMYDGVIREELTRNLNQTMMENYNYDSTITRAIDDMQNEFKCCGSESFEDWGHCKWFKGNTTGGRKTPDSCCKSPGEFCAQRDHPSNIDYIGCSRRLEQFVKESVILIGGIALGLCGIQLFGIIFSCCLIRKIKEAKYIPREKRSSKKQLIKNRDAYA